MVPAATSAVGHAGLPLDVAVLCRACAAPVPLLLFVAGRSPMRQVRCPGCSSDVVLHDAW
jgi:hypothetical protein